MKYIYAPQKIDIFIHCAIVSFSTDICYFNLYTDNV